MEWLNIHRSSVLDSDEFVGSDPVDRSTWLCLLSFCAGQENGGRIRGCREWADRKWQQIARVTKAEVNRTSDLWRWDGDDLVVAFYPIDQEQAVRAKREAGKETARKRWAQRAAQPDAQQPSSAVRSADSSAINSADAEGKEREGKEREEKTNQAAHAADVGQIAELPLETSFPPELATLAFRCAWEDWLAYRRERKLPAYKPRSLAAQLNELAEWGHDPAIASIRESIRQQWQGLFAPKQSGNSAQKPGGHPFQLPKSDHDKKF